MNKTRQDGPNDTTHKSISGFNPVKFIELLLKLDGRAKGQTVEVEVRKKDERKVATA